MTLQLFYLKKSLSELTDEQLNKFYPLPIKIRTDHLNGVNYLNNYKVPLTFPVYLKNYIDTQKKDKTIDYNFIGTITPKRKWIQSYTSANSIIRPSNYGRDPNKKYTIDTEYYDTMCKSKFTLTPTGDCPWSYRFFEAIMCMSIPVVEKQSNDRYKDDYFYYVDGDRKQHVYDKQKALENYNRFVNSHHFLINYSRK